MGTTRTVWCRGLAAIGVACTIAACGSDGLSTPPTIASFGEASANLSRRSSTGAPISGDKVRGWPDTTENVAGVYSWDGSTCSSHWCVIGFMHNGYGSGDVSIHVDDVPGGFVPDDGAMAITVAGHHGTYRRVDARVEEWLVVIDGTTIAIRLDARPGAAPSDLADARAIIASMHTEPRDGDLGFRIVFTIPTDDWDSG